MKTHVKMLKVKIKSLAAEARIIRLEERRAGRDNALREALHRHRIDVVRAEQRLSLLAYAFLRGRRLAAVEPKSAAPPDWVRVAKLVERFGTVEYGPKPKAAQAAALAAWKEAACPVPA